MDYQERQDTMESKDNKGQLVPSDQQVLTEKQALLVQQAKTDPKVQMEKLEQMVQQELQECKDPQVRQVLKDHKVTMGRPVLQVYKVPRENKGQMAKLGPMERLVL